MSPVHGHTGHVFYVRMSEAQLVFTSSANTLRLRSVHGGGRWASRTIETAGRKVKAFAMRLIKRSV